MRLTQYLNEKINIGRLEALKNVFSKTPSDTPEAIATFIVNALKASGIDIKPKNGTYISGPMTNLPDANWPVFIYAEKYLNGKVANPAKPHGKLLKKDTKKFTWEDYMTEDIYGMIDCNKIVFLPGYSKSTGAVVEGKIGEKLVGAKPKLFRDVVGESNYSKFMEDVKAQYLKDGNDKGYYSVIEPMLTAKSEKEAASFVKSYKPKSATDESIMSTIGDITRYIKNWTLKEVLKVIGIFLSRSVKLKVIR